MSMLEILAAFGAVSVAVFVATLSRIVADDAKTFVPRLAVWLIQHSAKRIHEDEAGDFCEEWLAHLNERSETTGKLFHACTIYLWGAGRICREVGYSGEPSRTYFIWKRGFDIFVSMLLLPTAVFTVITHFIIMWKSGPLLHRTEVIGKDGKPFLLIRIRTNYPKLETSPKNKYVTKPSKTCAIRYSYLQLVRKARLDEVTQIFNILQGDMTLIGPEPLCDREHKEYGSDIYIKMQPGMSGPSRLSSKSIRSLADRATIDQNYFKRRSILTDFSFVLHSIKELLLRKPDE